MIDLTAEGSGETVGEAKWDALRELERLVPVLDRNAVRFQVITEGDRGLLGVGAVPARVLASVPDSPPAPPEVEGSELAARLRSVVEHVTVAMGVHCRVAVAEGPEGIVLTCSGGDLGLLIGKHGQTIDAVQAVVSAIAAGSDERKDVLVDAAGYRDRRRRTLEALAVRCAEQALREGCSVGLEPMGPADRRLVHERLQRFDGVATESEGDEPHRYVVVKPTQ